MEENTYLLKLKPKGPRSYTAYGNKVTQESPFVYVTEEVAAQLMATGYFEEATEEEATAFEPPSAPIGTIDASMVKTKKPTGNRAATKEVAATEK